MVQSYVPVAPTRRQSANSKPVSTDGRGKWFFYFQCFGVAVSAGLVVAFLFCPRFGSWKGVVLTHGPIAIEYGRAVAALHQIEKPWAPIVFELHKVIAWRLLLPVIWHYLNLPFGLYLAMPHLGCLLTLWLTACLVQKRCNNWKYTWMTVALLATLPWFFVSTGWLGYFDSWLALGTLVASCVPSRWALALICLLVPWIDERIVLALPSCMIVRFIIFHDDARVPSRELLRDLFVAIVASLVYPTIRIVALLRGDPLTTSYVSAHWDEVHTVHWTQFLDGLWSGYRAAWLVILAGVYFCWRRVGWMWGAALTLILVVSTVASLFIAADMSRSMMIVLPFLLLGIYLWSKTQPQTFKWALPAVLIANLGLPASHVMWNLRVPIHYLPSVLAESKPWQVDPPMLLKQAENYIAEGKPAEAEVLIDAAVKLDDQFAPAYVSRAVQRGLRGDFRGAKVDIQSALSLTPDSADALFISATIAMKLNDVASAKADFQKAIENAPMDWPHRYETKQILEQLNKSGSRTLP
jgi:hypothetical protein